MTSVYSSQPLDDVADLLSGGTPRKLNESYWNGLIPWLTPKDMGKWSGATEAKVSSEAIGNGTRLAPADAIFIVVRGMSLHNEIRVIRPAQAMTFNQDIKAVVARQDVDPRYLYYVILSKKPELLDAVEAAGHGTGRLPTDRLKDLLIPRFGCLTETAIAELFTALDRRIDLNRRMNETLEAMARAVFKDWFVDFGPTRAKAEGRAPYLAPELWDLFPDALDDDGKPVGWTRKPLDEIADFLNGLALQKFSASDPDNSLPVIKIAELRGGITPKSSRASRDVPDKYIVKDGDFLFSWSGSLLAKFWTEGEGALNQHLFKVTSDRFPSWFFGQWVHHHLEEFRAIAASKATTMGHIQRRHLKEAMTILPPDDVLTLLGQAVGPLVQHTIKNDLESRILAETRDLLLPKLMSGEIRLHDAEKVVEAVA